MAICRHNRRPMILTSLSIISLLFLQSNHVILAQEAPDNGTNMAGTCDCDEAINAAKTAAATEMNLFQDKLSKSEETVSSMTQKLSICEESEKTNVEKVRNLEQELVSVKSALSSSKKLEGELNKKLSTSEGAEQTMTEKIAELEKKLATSIEAGQKMAEEVSDLEKRLASSMESEEELVGKLDDIEKELTSATSESSYNQQTIADLTKASEESTNKVTALEAELTRTKELLTEATSSHQTETSKLKELHAKDRAEIESNHNEALQKAVNLEASLTRVKSDRDLKTTEMKSKIDTLTDDLDKHKKMLRDSKDKYFDTRQELFAANDELRKMHEIAGSTYCNTTLIKEDSTKIFSIVGSKITVFIDEFYTETLVPLSRTLADIGEMFVERTNGYYEEYAEEHVDKVKETVGDLYDANVKPIIDEKVMPLVDEHVMPLVEKYRDPVEEAVESVRLTVVSVLKQTSKAAHAYLAVLKLDEGKLSPPAEWTLKQLKYCMDNSDEIVDTVAGYLPLFFAMMVTGCVILGSIAIKLGVPTSFVWAYCAIRFLFRSGPKKNVSNETPTGAKPTGKGKKKGKGKVKAQ